MNERLKINFIHVLSLLFWICLDLIFSPLTTLQLKFVVEDYYNKFVGFVENVVAVNRCNGLNVVRCCNLGGFHGINIKPSIIG